MADIQVFINNEMLSIFPKYDEEPFGLVCALWAQ